MNNTKITSNIILSLGILAILAFGIFVIPIKAEARIYIQDNGVYIQDNRVPINDKYNQNYISSYNQYPYQSYQAPTSYYETPTVYSNTSIAKTKSTASAVSTEKTTEEEAENKNDYQSLAANAIFGENGFLPSGLFQWILFGILILVIIILTRRIFSRTKKFHETPLKKS